MTVNRYCSSSLQTIRMAAHAIKAGEGDVFIAAGVETVSRYMQRHAADTGPHNAKFADAEARTAERTAGGQPTWTPGAGPARRLHRHGPDRRERGRVRERHPRGAWTSSPPRASSGPPPSLENGFWEQEITPVTTARRHRRVSKDDGIRAGTTVEGLRGLKPVFRPDGTVTAGNACPLNDGAAAVIVMSDTQADELGLTPLARIVSSGVTGLNPEIMGLGPIEACRQAWPGPA